MAYLKSFLNDILKRPSLYFFIFLVIFSIDRHKRLESFRNSERGPFHSDVAEYYSFLPGYFLGDNFGQAFETNRRTLGMAIMYLPAFSVGHAIAVYADAPRTGHSWPYRSSVRWGSILYSMLGLLICRKSLLFFFKEPVVLISLICVWFGTNLFYYTYGWGEFPHSYLFFLYSLFAFGSLKWILQKKEAYCLLIALAGGMIILIRPTGILVFLFPLLFNVHSFSDLWARIKYIFEKPAVAAFSLIVFMLPLLLQMMYWKKYMGQYIYYSYGKEGFFFNDPQIINFLFSYRKGWLIYTPVMAFSLIGIVLCRKKLSPFFLFITVFFLLNVYVLSSWWDWSYGGSFGCRAMIESYAFLIFPFSAFIAWYWELVKHNQVKKMLVRLPLLLILFFLIQLNQLQTLQYKDGLIHWSGMNKKTYMFTFLKEDFSHADRVYLYSQVTPPDIDKMLVGDRDH